MSIGLELEHNEYTKKNLLVDSDSRSYERAKIKLDVCPREWSEQ